MVLPNGQNYQANNPAKGITAISVIQTDASTIQVRVTGDTAVPLVQVIPRDAELVLSLTPPQDAIELTVTGEPSGYSFPNSATVTKTNVPLRDLSFNVQVIPQQIIQDQRALTIGEAIRNVSGFALSGRGS